MCNCRETSELVDKLNVTLQGLNHRVSGWADSLQMGPGDDWEYSSPMFCGGIASTYTLRSPFLGQSEFRVDSASAGATAAQVIVSPFRGYAQGFDFTGASQSFSESSPLIGAVMQVPASTTVAGPRGWYSIVNSEQSIYITIIAASNAAGVTVQFRQKRSN